ncbi:hypothetical protein ACFWPH_34355 [Nocardia sp. NPDC058499]|uniref:hypothetical protein n=1 Tax=Nocardia sp. NPDC058499 TaxID=3346530 RepID=UPI00365481B6
MNHARADTSPVIEFAIRWSPFGSPSSGELFVTSGVHRQRFIELLQEGLQTRRSDNHGQQWLERRLSEASISARLGDGDAATGAHRC